MAPTLCAMRDEGPAMAIDHDVTLLSKRRTKIVATLGPTSSDEETIGRLIEAGADVFRLNMSHGDHAGHRRTFDRARRAIEAAGRAIPILVDLAGPKIRVGDFERGEIELVRGARVTLTTRDVRGRDALIPSQYEGLAGDVSQGDPILLADGTLELEVEAVDETEIRCLVVRGGRLKDRKGINLPQSTLSAACLTDKDRDDARFALGLGVDFLGQSFVRRGSDCVMLKELVAESGRDASIIAKIERPEALADVNAILEAADGIMVARGDLGVELPPEKVPTVQRQLIDRARRHNKPVIVATQMLESMIKHTRPTRAEVSDVSNAVMSGTDALMLAAESATGAHPVLAVEMMDRIVRQAEGYLWEDSSFECFHQEPACDPPIPFGDAVARCTAHLSQDLRVHAVVAVSQGGMSAATLSAARPAAPVVCVSSSEATCRRMALLWGSIPRHVHVTELVNAVSLARSIARELGLAERGEYILLVRGFGATPARNTPSITLLTL